jgi:hypothetical protein
MLSADGWAADSLDRWEDDDPERGVTLWLTRWISSEKAKDFEYGYLRMLEARFGSGEVRVEAEGGHHVTASGRVYRVVRQGEDVRIEARPAEMANDENERGDRAESGDSAF